MNIKNQKIEGITKNPPFSPFSKGGHILSSLWQREVGRDFQSAKVLPFLKYFDFCSLFIVHR